GAADASALGDGRTVDARAVAALGDIADACRAAAHRAARPECIGRTVGAAPRARLRHVADAGGAAAGRAARLEVAGGRAARRERAVGAAALVAVLADGAVDRVVAAERRERDRHEVPV